MTLYNSLNQIVKNNQGSVFSGHQYLVQLKFGAFSHPTYGTLKLKFLTSSGLSDSVVFRG